MRGRLPFVLAAIGLAGALLSAYLLAVHRKPAPPAFTPPANPYEHGVYASGIIESEQASGANINVFPEVAGTVTAISAQEGQVLERGAPLLVLDDSIQRAVVEQQEAQAHAADALLAELKAQPRPENLRVAEAQVGAAQASLKTATDQLAKQRESYALDSRSVSKGALDDAVNAVKVAQANLDVAQRQLDLVRAGAWSFDVQNQEAQALALGKAAAAARALLVKYTVRAPIDGRVLAINATVGSYVSPQGTLDTYTQAATPIAVMGLHGDDLAVRAFIDEILVPKLGALDRLEATMFVRGTDVRVPLEFVRVQPYVSPKIELSNARTERVDLRVLPVIFRFERPPGVNLYPGQLVDVYVRTQ